MQHSPYCFISVNTQNLLKTQRTNTMLLTNHLPYSTEPHSQWYTSILKDGSCCNRSPKFAVLTSAQPVLYNPKFSMIASRTDKSIWPPHLIKIFSASFFSCKTLFKLKYVFRVIFHIPHILYIGGVAVKRITLNNNSYTLLTHIFLQSLNSSIPFLPIINILTRGYDVCSVSQFI